MDNTRVSLFFACFASFALAASCSSSKSNNDGSAGTGGSAGRGGSAGGSAGASGGAAGGTAGAAGGAAGGSAGASGGAGGGAGRSGDAGADATGGTTTADGGGTDGPSLTGTPARPLLTAASAANYTILKYLAQAGSLVNGLTVDNWDPTAGVDVSAATPMFTVDAGGAGTHTTVQAAITAAQGVGGTARIFVKVNAGTYREFVCVPSTAPPITLYGGGTDPTQTVIVNNHYSGEAKAAGVSANPCNANTTGTTYGTSGSATFAAFARGFQAKNLTFSNDLDELALNADAGATVGNVQAVALETQADQLVFDTVRVLGNQDTLYVKTSSVDIVARAYFKGCYVEGDVDFVFGRGTMVFDGCEIRRVSTRRGASASDDAISPSTDVRNVYGVLVINSMMTADTTTTNNTVALGRAWDEGQAANVTLYPPAGTTTYPNGQAVIRDSTIGAQARVATPWLAAATSSRPFNSTDTSAFVANRLYEFNNTGAGAAQ